MVAEEELAAPLEILPPVEFCCAYGSSLVHDNNDEAAMVDYILGVADPIKWHAENLERNGKHYAKWMAFLGPKAITCVADKIGVGVHFNPFVQWKQKMIKYGVVGMQDLSCDVLTWNRFYIGGRLQKPVRILVDNYGIGKVNAVNLKSAVTAALLLSPSEFTEEDLYSKICSLSYMGDLRMLFAEDKNKDCGLPATISLFSALPETIQRVASPKKSLSLDRDDARRIEAGCSSMPFIITSKEEAANCTRRVLRRLVMISSARQAAAGVLAAGGVNAARYLGRKMSKAWSSRIS